MQIKNTSVPVVVINSRYTHGIGIARSLGKLGINVYCVDHDALSPAFYSKYCTQKYVYNSNSGSQNLIKYLVSISREIKSKPILFATSDKIMNLVTNNRSILEKYYIFPSNSPSLVKSLTSKKEMFHLSKKNGFETPRALFPKNLSDLENCIDQIEFPVMLKGIFGNELAKKAGKKMFIVTGKNQLLHIFKKYNVVSDPTFLIQEYIPGADDTVWMFNGYFNNQSDCLFGITGRKIRQAPVYTGATSLGICERNDQLYELVTNFMKKIKYKGILDIGFKFDYRDNKYKVLDINPRIGATFRLFLGANGLDVARSAYLDLTNQSVPPTSNIEGRKWVVENNDLISSLRYIYDGKLSINEWLKSYHGVEELGWATLNDPKPFSIMFFRFIKEIMTFLRKTD